MEVFNLRSFSNICSCYFNILHMFITGQEAVTVEINTTVIYKYFLKNRIKDTCFLSSKEASKENLKKPLQNFKLHGS